MARGRSNQMADAAKEAQRGFALHKTLPMVMNNLYHQLKGREMYIPVWCGHPGIGKTTHAKMICRQMGLQMFYVSMCKPTEYFSGLPAINQTNFSDDNTELYVRWSEPEMIHFANKLAREAKEKNMNGCLIFLDDLHIMEPSVQKHFFELVLERKLGNFKLDDNVCMLGAMNSSAMAGFDGFLSAINNRLQKIETFMEFKYWYENCGAELNPIIAGYVRNFRDSLEEDENTESSFATYRSWTMLSRLIDTVYKQYLESHDNAWFLDQVYMYACTLMSSKLAQQLKNNASQQLQYDFESMVTTNRYHVDRDDPISQFCFGNIVRYLRNKQDVENLTDYIIKLVKSSDGNEYQNAVINVMYEALSFITFYRSKTDEEGKKKFQLYNSITSQLFNKGDGKIHSLIRSLLSGPTAITENRQELHKLEEATSK